MSTLIAFTLRKLILNGQAGKVALALLLVIAATTGVVVNLVNGLHDPTQAASALPTARPMSGLVAWWPLNEGTGITLDDGSGNKHTGQLSGNFPPSWIENPTDGVALQFVGRDGFGIASGDGGL